MKLNEIFQQLAVGEFSQLSIGGADAGVIDETNYVNVVNHVNLGLTALFKRFTLKEGRLTLELQDGMSSYRLHSSYAVNVHWSAQVVRYIKDTVAEPFVDDILKIEKVLADDDTELGLNDSLDEYSLFTPSALVLRVPDNLSEYVETDNLTVVYRATHPKIVVDSGYFEPSEIEVELPDSHLMALLYYVASRVHNPIGMTNEFHAGNNYAARYEAECQTLEGQGLQVDQGSQNNRLERNGWV